MSTMERWKFSEEQVAYALRQVEAGTPVADLCRQLGVVVQFRAREVRAPGRQ
jgi:hypothetical protein